ncbi:MAG TPA: hypothetical protein VFD43_07725 [Planctomycetota bacterium]|nr:hypothetical protein [Planctomycetota bacterium]
MTDMPPSNPNAPESREPAAEPRPAARSLNLRRISIALAIVAIFLSMLAGVPSTSRMTPPRPLGVPQPGLSLRMTLTHSDELSAAFAELREPVDAAGQRPAYPTTAELGARLEALPGWDTAALFAPDATAAELFAAGVTDPELAMALNPAPMAESFPMFRHWKLVLLDDGRRIVGTTLFEVPAPEVERVALGDGAEAGPQLERRFPDWPRAAVFTRTAGGAQSDG